MRNTRRTSRSALGSPATPGWGEAAQPPHWGIHQTQSSPSKAIDKEPHREGANHAPNREDGNREGPECGKGGRADGLLVSVQPRAVVEILNHLENKERNQIKHQTHPLSSRATRGTSPCGYRSSQDNASPSPELPAKAQLQPKGGNLLGYVGEMQPDGFWAHPAQRGRHGAAKTRQAGTGRSCCSPGQGRSQRGASPMEEGEEYRAVPVLLDTPEVGFPGFFPLRIL